MYLLPMCKRTASKNISDQIEKILKKAKVRSENNKRDYTKLFHNINEARDVCQKQDREKWRSMILPNRMGILRV